MADGFEVGNQSGVGYQIDGKNISIVLTRHIRVPTTITRESNTSLGTGAEQFSSLGFATVYPGEMVAISSDSACSIISTPSAGGQVMFATRTIAGTMVDLFFFAPLTGSSAREGLQVFRESDNALLFCASKRPLSIAGVIDGYASASFPAGRRYAVVAALVTLQTDQAFQGGDPNENSLYTERMSLARITGSQVAVESTFTYMTNSPPGTGYQPTFQTPFNSRYVVIDVTGYA